MAIHMQAIQQAESYLVTIGDVIDNTVTNTSFKAYHYEIHETVQSAKLSYIAIGI